MKKLYPKCFIVNGVISIRSKKKKSAFCLLCKCYVGDRNVAHVHLHGKKHQRNLKNERLCDSLKAYHENWKKMKTEYQELQIKFIPEDVCSTMCEVCAKLIQYSELENHLVQHHHQKNFSNFRGTQTSVRQKNSGTSRAKDSNCSNCIQKRGGNLEFCLLCKCFETVFSVRYHLLGELHQKNLKNKKLCDSLLAYHTEWRKMEEKYQKWQMHFTPENCSSAMCELCEEVIQYRELVNHFIWNHQQRNSSNSGEALSHTRYVKKAKKNSASSNSDDMNSIQKRHANSVFCLLCKCSESTSSVQNHLRGKVHQKNLKNKNLCNSLLAYHTNWKDMKVEYQKLQIYFVPDNLNRTICKLCSKVIQYCELENHLVLHHQQRNYSCSGAAQASSGQENTRVSYAEKTKKYLVPSSSDVVNSMQKRHDRNSLFCLLCKCSAKMHNHLLENRHQDNLKNKDLRDSLLAYHINWKNMKEKYQKWQIYFMPENIFCTICELCSEVIQYRELENHLVQSHEQKDSSSSKEAQKVVNVPSSSKEAQKVVNVPFDSDGVNAIQRRHGSSVLCLLCKCSQTIFSVYYHLQGKKHQKNLKNKNLCGSLLAYHTNWNNIKDEYQKWRIYYMPENRFCTMCELCSEIIQYMQLENHLVQYHQQKHSSRSGEVQSLEWEEKAGENCARRTIKKNSVPFVRDSINSIQTRQGSSVHDHLQGETHERNLINKHLCDSLLAFHTNWRKMKAEYQKCQIDFFPKNVFCTRCRRCSTTIQYSHLANHLVLYHQLQFSNNRSPVRQQNVKVRRVNEIKNLYPDDIRSIQKRQGEFLFCLLCKCYETTASINQHLKENSHQMNLKDKILCDSLVAYHNNWRNVKVEYQKFQINFTPENDVCTRCQLCFKNIRYKQLKKHFFQHDQGKFLNIRDVSNETKNLYPNSLISDDVNSIQKRQGDLVFCLLCKCYEMQEHVLLHLVRKKHQRHLRNTSLCDSLFAYHTNWQKIKPEHRKLQINFIPEDASHIICQLCSQKLPYSSLQKHIYSCACKIQIHVDVSEDIYQECFIYNGVVCIQKRGSSVVCLLCKCFETTNNLHVHLTGRKHRENLKNQILCASLSAYHTKWKEIKLVLRNLQTNFLPEDTSSTLCQKCSKIIHYSDLEEHLNQHEQKQQQPSGHRCLFRIKNLYPKCFIINGVISIQIEQGKLAFCLLCKCFQLTHLVRSHLRGKRHRRNLKNKDLCNSLSAFHMNWKHINERYQNMQFLFIPEDVSHTMCRLCLKKIEYNELETHLIQHYQMKSSKSSREVVTLSSDHLTNEMYPKSFISNNVVSIQRMNVMYPKRFILNNVVSIQRQEGGSLVCLLCECNLLSVNKSVNRHLKSRGHQEALKRRHKIKALLAYHANWEKMKAKFQSYQTNFTLGSATHLHCLFCARNVPYSNLERHVTEHITKPLDSKQKAKYRTILASKIAERNARIFDYKNLWRSKFARKRNLNRRRKHSGKKGKLSKNGQKLRKSFQRNYTNGEMFNFSCEYRDLLYFTIQKIDNDRVHCIVCLKFISNTKCHILEETHKSMMNRSIVRRTLKLYHDVWVRQDPQVQFQKIYFRRRRSAMICLICTSYVNYDGDCLKFHLNSEMHNSLMSLNRICRRQINYKILMRNHFHIETELQQKQKEVTDYIIGLGSKSQCDMYPKKIMDYVYMMDQCKIYTIQLISNKYFRCLLCRQKYLFENASLLLRHVQRKEHLKNSYNNYKALVSHHSFWKDDPIQRHFWPVTDEISWCDKYSVNLEYKHLELYLNNFYDEKGKFMEFEKIFIQPNFGYGYDTKVLQLMYAADILQFGIIKNMKIYPTIQTSKNKRICLLCDCNVDEEVLKHLTSQQHVHNANDNRSVENLVWYHSYWSSEWCAVPSEEQANFVPEKPNLKCIVCKSSVHRKYVKLHVQSEKHKSLSLTSRS